MKDRKHIEINIGKACNNKCRFCMSQKSIPMKLKFIDIDTLKEKISGYRKKSYNSIGFLGGDISIYPKFEELIIFCKKQGFEHINIITNAMVFDDMDFAKKIIVAGVTRVNISIHSHIDEIEDFLTQIPGGLKRKLQAIDNLNHLNKIGIMKDPISINIVLNKQNYKTITETCLFFYKKGINDIRINFLRPNKFSEDYYDDILLKYYDSIIHLRKVILLYYKLGGKLRITFDSIPPCILKVIGGKDYKKIIKTFFGEAYDNIIEWIDDSNNTKENIIFNRKQRKKDILKTKVKGCDNCIFEGICDGVRKEYVRLYGGSEFIGVTNK